MAPVRAKDQDRTQAQNRTIVRKIAGEGFHRLAHAGKSSGALGVEPALLGFDIRKLDHLGPFFGVIGNTFSEFIRRHRQRLEA
jgi:hypothetical protein